MSSLPLSQLMVVGRATDTLIALDNHQRYYWPQFRAAVVALAQQLSAQPGKRWLLYSDNSYQFAIGLLALLHTGKTVLLPNNVQPATLTEWRARCDGMLGVDGGWPIATTADSGDGCFAFTALDENNSFIEVVTSGSSGEPQVIRKALSCFQREISLQSELWREKVAGATIFATVSHQHIYGLLFRILLPLHSGCPFWATSHPYWEPLLADIGRQPGPALLVSSPAHLSRLPVELTAADAGGQLRMITSSGGPLALAAAEQITQQLGITPHEIFGSTETGGVAWRQQTEPDQPWQPFADITVQADEESGQLSIQSPYCVVPDGWLMGDKVAIECDGSFRLLGRADRIVKVEEKRLSLTAMEAHLQACDWVAEAKVLQLPGGRQPLVAVVILNEVGGQLLAERGKRAVNDALKAVLLAHYERVLLPRKWRYVTALPVNSQGKTPLSELAQLFADEPVPAIAFHCTEQSDNRCLFNAELTSDQPEFQGHFPGLPLLPGVVQLDNAIRHQPWYAQTLFLRVNQLKFKDLTIPGVTLTLELNHKSAGKVAFQYRQGHRSLSSGVLVFGEFE
ncbi:AMP-binding protein [Halioxenophilus sp. WMMB6]|uniref:AMP-binding protein n=1 Tax=Halioxenophilus sp. WMMB6 TaxID=3073815 RepID=UPI00295EC9DC|nr:AMP-binding protein [Halioxenophilus sp. WMMB6]